MKRDETDSRRTRRDVLRAGAGALAAGAASLGGGCLATMPPLGQRVHFGKVEVPDASAPTYQRWIPAVTDLDRDISRSLARGTLFAVMPGELGGETLGISYSLPYTTLKPVIDYFGIGFERYDRIVSLGSVFALLGDVDRSLVTSTATEAGYRPAGSYAGYEVFARSDVPRRIALGEDGLVWSSGSAASADLRAVLDEFTVRLKDGEFRFEVDRRSDDVAARLAERWGDLGR